MATALSGHIDDCDGAPTRLEGFSPICPHFPPDQPGFWSVVEQVTKGPSPVRTRCHLQPELAGRRRVRDRRRPRDNPAEPGHTFADHEHTLRSAAEVGTPGVPRGRSGARTNELEAEEASRRSHTGLTNCADSSRTVRPDLAQHARPWIGWTPLDGRYDLRHVGPSCQSPWPSHAATASGLPPHGGRVRASACKAVLASPTVWPGVRAVAAGPTAACRRAAAPGKDADHSRANDSDELSMTALCAGQRCVAAVPPADEEPAGGRPSGAT